MGSASWVGLGEGIQVGGGQRNVAREEDIRDTGRWGFQWVGLGEVIQVGGSEKKTERIQVEGASSGG